MHTVMHAGQESGLSMTLTGLKLDKYLQLFNKKCIKFDTFVNMTKEDLINIGIFDETDQVTILEGIEPLRHLYKEVNDLGEPNFDAILGNTVHHLKGLLGLMIVIKRKLHKSKPKNMLLDLTHSAGGAIIHLLDVIDAEIEWIREDLSSAPAYVSHKSKTSSGKTYCLLGCLTTVVCLSTLLAMKYVGKTTIVDKLNFLPLFN